MVIDEKVANTANLLLYVHAHVAPNVCTKATLPIMSLRKWYVHARPRPINIRGQKFLLTSYRLLGNSSHYPVKLMYCLRKYSTINSEIADTENAQWRIVFSLSISE